MGKLLRSSGALRCQRRGRLQECAGVNFARHAACLHNRRRNGQDGRTPLGRLAGKRSGTVAAEFGEKGVFLTLGPDKESQLSFGIGPGLATLMQEANLGTPG